MTDVAHEGDMRVYMSPFMLWIMLKRNPKVVPNLGVSALGADDYLEPLP